MKFFKGITTGSIFGLMMSCALPVSAIEFRFDYSYDNNGFFDTGTLDGQAARTRLETAANVFEPFTDNLSAITPGGSNSWTATFFHPATGNTQQVNNLTIAENEILVYAGGYDLSGSTIGQGGFGGYSASGTADFFDTLRRGQGSQDDIQGSTATEFASWGGSITFDTEVTWNFDETAPNVGENDFFSVAVHELAHLLGFGTADSWNNLVSGTNFIGSQSTSVYGSNPPLEADGVHWLDGTTSVLPGTETLQETAMDPSITVGTRKEFTVLDYAGLDDTGWDVPTELSGADSTGVPFEAEGTIGLVVVASYLFYRDRKKRKQG